jgi:hypothetical protein
MMLGVFRPVINNNRFVLNNPTSIPKIMFKNISPTQLKMPKRWRNKEKARKIIGNERYPKVSKVMYV